VLVEEKLSEHSAELGAYFLQQLQTKLSSPLIKEVRGKGLFIGIEIDIQRVNGRELCIQLIHDGLLTKETHDTVIRLCPPLIVTREQVDEAVHILQHSFKVMEAK
jgi:ornithine--oxo-acid transaminase